MIEVKILPSGADFVVFLDHVKKTVCNMNNHHFIYYNWNKKSNTTISLMEFEQ